MNTSSTSRTDTTDPAQVKPFASFLQEQAKGASHAELSEALRALVLRVKDTEKKGQIVYVVNIEPMKGDPSLLVVKDEIKVKYPEHDRSASLFYEDDGNLVRDDPNQPEIPGMLREVPAVNMATGEIREIGGRP